LDIPSEGSGYERAGHVWYEAAGRILYPELRASIDKPWMWKFAPKGYEGTVFMSPAAAPDANIRISSYAYNEGLYAKANGNRKFSLYFSLSKTVMIADGSGKSHSLTPAYETGYINARHGASSSNAGDGQAVAAYLDGHADVLSSAECAEVNADGENVFWGEEL
jgi:hypothetical protein